MLLKTWRKFGWVWILLAVIGLQGCGSSSSNETVSSPIPVPEAAINPATLDSAASFLAAATGKENPLNVDQVVFVNTVLGINQPEPLEALASVASSSEESSMGSLYGDLWIMLRDESGIPVLDDQGCEQPIAAQPIELPLLDDDGNPITYFSDTVPMSLEEYMDGEFKCEVVAEYVDFTIPVEMGRLNMVRSSVKNPDTMARAFEEAMKNINASVAISADLAGRLILISEQDLLDEAGNLIGTELVESTIDAPRENLALYRALMIAGRLVGFGVEKTGEEGQTTPAPWLEIRSDLDLGDLTYLRDGTPGRSRGVAQVEGFADLSAVFHSTEVDYSGQYSEYVQFYPDADPLMDVCPYTDESSEVWQRVFASNIYQGDNIRGFAKHADDARKMIVFMHNIIQDVPQDGTEPVLDAEIQVTNEGHAVMPEIIAGQQVRHLMLETAASALGAASGKEVPLSVDATVFVNTLLGINQLGDLSAKDLYGDLWILKRDVDGAPLLDEELGCIQPMASQTLELPLLDAEGLPVLDDEGNPVTYLSDTVPMMLEEYQDGQFKCAPLLGFEDYVMEVEMGRLNSVRSSLNNPSMMDRHLYEVVNRINAAVGIKRDLAGRIMLTTEKEIYDDEGTLVGVELVDSAIDSPLENLAVYGALMKYGTLEVPVTVNMEGTKETFTLAITLADEILEERGMRYLKYGDGSQGQPVGIGHLEAGYAQFSELSHCPKADYVGVPVDFVERQDDVCFYADKNDEIWTRVLGSEIGARGESDAPASNIAAFVEHADDARRVIGFIHRIIQDPVMGL